MTEDQRGSNGAPASKTEQIQALAAQLAEQYGQASEKNPGRSLTGALASYENWLAEAHHYFRDATRQALTLSYASEWVLDNYYIVRQGLSQIHEDLPAGYYNQLPKLPPQAGSLAGLPRIYAIVRGLLGAQNLLLNPDILESALIEVQKHVSLSMGELWAVPIFLRFSLVEALAQALVLIIQPSSGTLRDSAAHLPEAHFEFLPKENGDGAGGPANGPAARQAAAHAPGGVQTLVNPAAAVANTILSLRSIGEQDWNTFFESVSRVEQTLRQDPAGVYPQMDFRTRDSYRKAVEHLARDSGRDENELAEIALQLARAGFTNALSSAGSDRDPWASRRTHVGFYLLGQGSVQLHQRAGYQPRGWDHLVRWAGRHAGGLYITSILGLAALIVVLISLNILHPAASLGQRIAVPLLLVIPAVTIAASLASWLVTVLFPPRRLPKLDFREAIPAPFRTLVVIPALITSREEVDSLIQQLEMQFLRNPIPGLLFALLTDFGDADTETRSEDEALVQAAVQAIDQLNQRYQTPEGGPNGGGRGPFFFLHRKRLWNPSEGRWMGWERKRGKLHELNRLLRRKDGLSFSHTAGDIDLLTGDPPVRFVITLDADTILPRGTAGRLAGALAHPLNQAVFNETDQNRVTTGYTILQPRMEINPTSTNRTWFTRIFAGDAGLDLYTLAVSDAYQDLTGEGIYVGKGIYDVDAFERSVAGQIPENTLLSHDLLEGLLGRSGLVTDITMVEDYPQTFFVQTLRQHRWIRGDWQLLPWLLHPRLSLLDRWKMLDNLRRSLMAPGLLLMFVLGLIWLPGPALLWTGLLLLALGIPLLTGLTRGALQAVTGEQPASAFRPVAWDLLRWLLAVAFLPYDAFTDLDAIFTTLYRVFISHRNLLQWRTAAHTERVFRKKGPGSGEWKRMIFIFLLAVLLVIILISENPAALPVAAPVLLLWVFSPLIVRWAGQPIDDRPVQLSPHQVAQLRAVARRTWGFFERYVGPEDHWLPPDHYQEFPLGIVAHRTSPTNIGLLLNSTLAAFDLGYLDPLALVTRLTATIDTLQSLERYRGHFLNWFDTLTLQPLRPRYVSTVDSGNLAASLIVTAQACRAMPRERLFRWALWQGYLDGLESLCEVLSGSQKAEGASAGASQPAASQAADRTSPDGRRASEDRHTIPTPGGPAESIAEILHAINEMEAAILAAQDEPSRWYYLFQVASGPFWQDIASRLGTLLASGRSGLGLDRLRRLQSVANQVSAHHMSIQRTINELVPWLPLLESPPELLCEQDYAPLVDQLRAALPSSLELVQVRAQVEAARELLTDLREQIQAAFPEILSAVPTGGSGTHAGALLAPPRTVRSGRLVMDQTATDAIVWLDALEQALSNGAAGVGALLNGYTQIAEQCERYVNEMDFRFLYHAQRRIFHIGFNVDSGQLDNNFYDLLASEARIASLLAIARHEVSQAHWLHMSRPVTAVDGKRVLLSWSATMFEYLMPPLFLRPYPGTLLTESAQGAVAAQIAYGKQKGVPWGISESGFYRFDGNQNYQYRAFGVPGLGFKRGLGDDLVIAPYASLMAISYDPLAVLHNMQVLKESGGYGLWGFYEAIDFTPDRLLVGQKHAVVREYMAHHQGMILLALDNYFNNDVMVQRMHADPRIESVDLLLQEQVPLSAPVQSPYTGDVKGVQRMAATSVQITPWTVPVQTPIPQVHLLSNGDYSLLISNAGGGYSTWRDTDLTRWQPDGVLDPWGQWVYIQDLEQIRPGSGSSGLWSAAYQPIPGDPNANQVTFYAHMVMFRREQDGLIATLETTVSPNDPVEIRRLHLNNPGGRARRMRVCSYGEVILNQQSADARHPAFNRLFVESEWYPELKLQIFKRRPRSEDEAPVYMGHMLVMSERETRELEGKPNPQPQHETDRAKFIGRTRTPRTPAGLLSGQPLSGSSGATLDSIFAIAQELELRPHESDQLAYLTLAAASREELIALAERYQNWALVDRSFHQADLSAQAWLGQQNMDTQALNDTLQALSGLIFPLKALRAPAEVISANRLGQPGLWRFGVSGDYPILLVDVEDPTQLDLVRQSLQVHRYLRSRRVMIDVVILNHQQTDYGAELNAMLYRLVSRANSEQWLNQRGGIFVLYADQMQPEERNLLLTAARVLLTGEKGGLSQQMTGYSIQVPHLPELTPTLPVPEEPPQPIPESEGLAVDDLARNLQFFNGYGGFSADGREYILLLQPGQPTPAPWVNVIGYPHFGFLVTESGSQNTWAVNSGENRLTPWSNDPVRDPSGEMLYLRDEETAQVWTPTPLPAGPEQPFRVTHSAGFTRFEHLSHGLEQCLTLFASPEDPIKVIHLSLRNTSDRPRRITATQYVEWVLGVSHAGNQPFILPEYVPEPACLLATNPYSNEFSERTAFLTTSLPVHGVTADRAEFFGRNGDPSQPAALRRMGLETRITPGEDPCAVLQVHVDLLPGAKAEVYFTLGQGNNREHALALVQKYQDSGHIGAAWQRTQVFWDRLLDAVQVHTPQPAADFILNRWLLYQTLSCRIWGRTAFYQSSGAFGFRDQLQDVLALLPIDPAIARGQILNAAAHQFEAGDVLHWWHPPSGRGVRTRFSDDLLWLPYVTALYVEATGDLAILDEQQPFLQAPPLKEGEHERYGLYPAAPETHSLFEHCCRAVERGMTKGPHGLPLIGTGDWNDGLNRVGAHGKGESVWMAWFLYDVLERFAGLCELRGAGGKDPTGGKDPSAETSAANYRRRAAEYARAVEQSAWDGAWYRRAYYDDGAPLGSKEDAEAKIDSIAQSWAILSGAGDKPNLLNPQHTRQAMQSVLEHLVRPRERLILLFTPPFDQTPHDPGYIKGYLPGTRENGGQYTHAATWAAWAFARLGDGKQAGALFDLLNPVLQAPSAKMAAAYRVEPYVICADIYSVEPYVRRGGWTWYTGSAAWMYRLGLEAILGFTLVAEHGPDAENHQPGAESDGRPRIMLRLDPVIPPEWDGFSIAYRRGEAVYQIKVSNPAHVARGIKQVRLDGQTVQGGLVPLTTDPGEHRVEVEMG